jgi:ribosomal protein L11 methyltransferase
VDDDYAPPSGQLLCLRVRAASEDLEVIAASLFDAGAGGLVEEEDSIIVYTEGRTQLAEFQAALCTLKEQMGERSREPITWSVDIPTNDWQKKWQSALGPERVTPTFTLRPTHCSRGPDDEETLWFQPAASFGSGQHATTRLAACAVEEWVLENPGSSVLDVGTGTGVLAFIAAKLGARPVLGVDIDDLATQSALENARLNDLRDHVQIRKGTAESVIECFDLVVANMNTHILLPAAAAIAARLKPGASLVLAGLLDEDVPEVTGMYGTHGVALSVRETLDGWSLLVGRR